MYTVSTFRLAQAIDTPLLLAIPRVFIFVAVGAWVVTLIGLVREVVSGVAGGRRTERQTA
jgi:hypothetical protein